MLILMLFFVGLIHAEDNAVKRLEQQLVYQPHNVSLIHQIGDAHYNAASFEQARNYYEQAASEATSPRMQAELLANVGASYAQLQQYEKALEAYNKALALLPDEPRANHNKPILEELLKKQKEQQPSDKQREQNNQQRDQSSNNDQRSEEEQEHQKQDAQEQKQDKQRESKQQRERQQDQQKQQTQDSHNDQSSQKEPPSKGNAEDKQQQQSQSESKQQPTIDQQKGNLDRSKPRSKQEPQVDQKALDQAKEHIAQARTAEQQIDNDLQERVGTQGMHWLEQIAEHEKQGQQLLVQYQAQQNQQEEYGAKNW